jgi:putative ABC transport system ATP-binding protein
VNRSTGALTTIRRGLQLSPEFKKYLPVAISMAVLATLGRVVTPVVVQQILDRGILGDEIRLGFSLSLAGIGVAVTIATAVSGGLMQLWAARMSESVLSGLRVRTFRHIHDLSMLHQAAERRGALVARVTSDIDQISRFMEWASLMILVSTGQAVIAVVVMFVYSVPLTLVALASVPVLALVIRFFQSRLEKAFLKVREAVADMSASLAETVTGASVIRAYGAEAQTRSRLRRTIEHHRRTAVAAGRLSATFSGVAEVISSAVVAATLVTGTVLAVRGDTTVGTVVAFLFLVQLFIDPIGIVGEAINEAQTAVAGWRRVLDILDTAPDVTDPEDGADLPDPMLDIEFRSVAFRYPNPGERAADASGTRALSDVSVTIEPRTTVAVVGETGSGKTTFAKLAVRLMDPTAGSVCMGGIDLRRVRFGSLRSRVVMVPQEGALFRGTIQDNVAMGRPSANGADVRAVFSRLGLDDWLAELSQGLDTQVGERGNSLSVGERQLVTLVRAAISDPEILVLDEATSSVDPATEVRLSSALEQLSEGRTMITIAHRLSTAEAADRVLVFDGGRLVQDGPHRELVAIDGVYAGLYASWRRGIRV